MPRLIDEKKVEELLKMSVPQEGVYLVLPIKDFVLNVIRNSSTEVVRCKDCKYCIGMRCIKDHSLNDFRSVDHYCAWGERREDAKTN